MHMKGSIVKRSKSLKALTIGLVAATVVGLTVPVAGASGSSSNRQFERIAHFPVFENSNQSEQTVAEIIDVSRDGKTLIYSDAVLGAIGFIDIRNPEAPEPKGTLDVNGDPTSVAVAGKYALVGVNTSPDFDSPSGVLAVVDIASQTLVTTIPLAGQPDSVKISPDRKYAAVVIENERDEEEIVDGVEGGLPQLPAGLLQVVRLNGSPDDWSVGDVDLTGLAVYAPEDPEVEFVDINKSNHAVVTLQENNHIAIVDLKSRQVIKHFPAGEVTLDGVDTLDDGQIALVDTITRAREPDGVSWLPGDRIVTANEGDLFGGSRGFTIFDRNGNVRFDSGTSLEEIAVAHGHYPDARSDAKGTEPEGVDYGKYGSTDYLFVGSERGSFVAVYKLDGNRAPKFTQLLPAGWGPEGLLPIPDRNLLVVTGEEDDSPNGIRAVVSIYRLESGPASYPNLVSVDDPNGVPIGWAAMSGLAAAPNKASRLYGVWDSFFSTESRIFTIDVSKKPARITKFLTITGGGGNFDAEGIAAADDGTFWVASEGNASDSRPNRLLHVGSNGSVLQEVGLPAQILTCRADTANDATLGSGFEGVAIGEDGLIYVAQQRGWDYTTPGCEALDDDQAGLNANGEPLHTRIWVYDPVAATWGSIGYELAPLPPLAAWVGLSEITLLPNGEFAVIERDNLTGSFSEIKSLMKVDLVGDADGAIQAGEKVEHDVLAALRAGNGWIHDKLEGFAVADDGASYVVTDNDGVDDSSGETQFLRLGRSSRLFTN